MNIKKAIEENGNFRKGTWDILFDDGNDGDETEFDVENAEELIELWEDFCVENDFDPDSVEEICETFEPFYGGWFGEKEKDDVIYEINKMLENTKAYEFDEVHEIILKAAIEYIKRSNVNDDFWVNGKGELMKFRYRYEDNIVVDNEIYEYKTESEMEDVIEEELNEAKKYFYDAYDYGEFRDENGNLVTEIWEIGGDRYARWTRL